MGTVRRTSSLSKFPLGYAKYETLWSLVPVAKNLPLALMASVVIASSC